MPAKPKPATVSAGAEFSAKEVPSVNGVSLLSGSLHLDAEGVVISCEPSASTLLGIHDEIKKGTLVTDLLPAEPGQELLKCIATSVISGRRSIFDGIILDRHIEFIVMPQRSRPAGGCPCHIYLTDITESDPNPVAPYPADHLYRALFNNMLNGIAFCRMHYNTEGHPIDFTYLAVNHAFEVQTGLKGVTGKRVSKIIPGISEKDPQLFEIYGRVARTGTAERFETYVSAMDMWFEISVYSPRRGYFVAIFDVVSDIKNQLGQLAYQARLLSTVNDAIYATDEKNVITYWNQSAEKIYGWKANEAIGAKARQLLGTRFPEGDYDLILGRIIRDGDWKGEVKQVRKGGIELDAEASTFVIRDDGGKTTGLVTVTRDITERKRSEQEILRLNRIYSVLGHCNCAMVNQADISSLFDEICKQTVERGQFRFAWVGLLDLESGLLKPAASFGVIPGFVDRVGLLLSGPNHQKLASYRAISENRTIVINDVDNDPVAHSWRSTALDQNLHALASTPIRLNDSVIGTFTIYANEPGCFGPREIELIDELALDISFAIAYHEKEAQRKAATDELRLRERRLRTLHMLDRIILTGQDAPEVMARVALEQLIGLMGLDRARIEICNEAGAIESVLSVPEIKIPDDKDGNPCTPESVSSDSVGAMAVTCLRVPVGTAEKTTGDLFLYWDGQHVASQEEMEIAREVAGQVSIAFENTRLRRQAAHYANELENRVLERTAQLEAANKELEAFSYSVSHDLRSPLRAMNGFSQMLMEGYSNVLDDEGRRLLRIIHENASRMGNLINDLLALARIGRHELVFSRIDMSKIVREVFEESVDPADRNRVDFRLPPLPPAYGDETLLRQVWANLISNAVKYSGKKQSCRIEVGFTETPFEIIYFLRDNGAGFNMEFADKLFGVFQRLHSPSQFDGTGVGLAIVKRIITRLEGRVWATGKVNEGATFYFALPGLPAA